MRIKVEFLGLPIISDTVGKNELELDVSGSTVKDVIDELIKRYDNKIKDVFYRNGSFNPMIQIALNGKSFVAAEEQETFLKEGDSLKFMIFLAGG